MDTSPPDGPVHARDLGAVPGGDAVPGAARRPGVEHEPGVGPDRGAAQADAEADARALASVVRMRILRLCLDEAQTNREIARRLGKDPATTYHHVRTLAERGFLTAQPERRGARGAREVPYLATRKSWRSPMPQGQDRVLIETFLEEVAESDPRTVSTARLGVRLGPEAWEQAKGRFATLLQDLADLPADPDGTPYSIFVALHEDAGRRAD